jgi:hypothetical protein
LISGDEQDAVWARKILCVFQKAGVASKTKKRIRRRRRHIDKLMIQMEGGND